MLESKGPIETVKSGDRAVTIGNCAGAMTVAILALLSQASDGRRETSRPASSAAVSENIRPAPGHRSVCARLSTLTSSTLNISLRPFCNALSIRCDDVDEWHEMVPR